MRHLQFQKTPTKAAAMVLALASLSPLIAAAEEPRYEGRVGYVYLTKEGVGGLRAGERGLHYTPEGALESRGGEESVTEKDGVISVKLDAKSGTFTTALKDGVKVIDGKFGTNSFTTYPVHIELANDHVFMKWGFYERTLKPIVDDQAPPSCRRYARYDGSPHSWVDVMDICGSAFANQPPDKELVVAFLLNGFKKTPRAATGSGAVTPLDTKAAAK